LGGRDSALNPAGGAHSAPLPARKIWRRSWWGGGLLPLPQNPAPLSASIFCPCLPGLGPLVMISPKRVWDRRAGVGYRWMAGRRLIGVARYSSHWPSVECHRDQLVVQQRYKCMTSSERYSLNSRHLLVKAHWKSGALLARGREHTKTV